MDQDIQTRLAAMEKTIDQLKTDRIGQQDIIPSSIKPLHLVATTTPRNGDLHYSDGTNFVNLGIGSTGQFLTVTGGKPAWQTYTPPSTPVGFSSGCSVYCSTNQSITANVQTKVHMDTKEYDLGTEFDAATNYRFTATNAGKYIITFSVMFGALTATHTVFASIYKNGSQFKQAASMSAGGQNITGTCSAIVSLVATDYIEFFVDQDFGTVTLSGISTSTFASIQRLV